MRTVLADLIASLNGIRDITADITAKAPAALADAALRKRHETILCASTVILTGYFESFLRGVAEAAIRDICGRALPFADLPEEIRQAHFEQGGRVLQNAAVATRTNRTTWIRASSQDISRRLHSVGAGSPYEILWEAFADTRANPGPDVVKDFLERLGVSGGWSSLALRAAVPPNAMVVPLRELVRIRNECAHSGTVALIPLPSRLEDFCTTLEQVSTAIVEVLEIHVATL